MMGNSTFAVLDTAGWEKWEKSHVLDERHVNQSGSKHPIQDTLSSHQTPIFLFHFSTAPASLPECLPLFPHSHFVILTLTQTRINFIQNDP